MEGLRIDAEWSSYMLPDELPLEDIEVREG